MKPIPPSNRSVVAILAGMILALAAPQVPAQALYSPYTFTTFVGNSGYGSVDGAGNAASFNMPYGVTVDASSNIYVGDAGNAVIRKITPDGVVTTLAGLAGNYGSADGIGSAARFLSPSGVAVDTAGMIYVIDTDNYAIRKVTPDGIVTTLAGKVGFSGSVDGTGSLAKFSRSRGIAVDGAGNVYVADTENATIRKVTPDGVVTTLAGLAGSTGSTDGLGTNARFYFPVGIAVDGAGNIYVGDSANCSIRKVTPLGQVTTFAGKSGAGGSVDGTGAAARFSGPCGVAVDGSSNVFVTDTGNNEIRMITGAGAVTTLAGLHQLDNMGNPLGDATDGTGSAARFNGPNAVAVNGTGGLYVADTDNNTIRQMAQTESNWTVTTFAGLAGSVGSVDGTDAFARFNWPTGVAVDSFSNLFVVDRDNNTVRKVTADGVVTTLAGSPGASGSLNGIGKAARFNAPWGVGVNGAGAVFVADAGNCSIREITNVGSNWTVATIAGQAGSPGYMDGPGSVARFNSPTGIAIDTNGNIYVADQIYDTIREVSPSGSNWMVTTLAGLAGEPGAADGIGGNARFTGPTGLTVDNSGTLYVADSGNNAIRVVTPMGTNWVVTTLAGSLSKFTGWADGIGSAAQFTGPTSVAVDGGGNLFVADSGNDTIRLITRGAVVTTIGGTNGFSNYGNEDGTGSIARFSEPLGVAVDGAGVVYVADTKNNTIRKGYAAPPALAPSGSFVGFTNGQFNFMLTGLLRGSVVVESSADLATWGAVWTNTNSSPAIFSDPTTGADPNRFYRLRAP